MLGCGAPGDSDEAFLVQTLNEELTEGLRLAESFNDGPAFFDARALAVRLVDSAHGNAGLVNVNNCIIPTDGWPSPGTLDVPVALANDLGAPILQDTRDWYAVHNKRVNLAMADGSVKTVVDLNGDGFLNPGFDISQIRSGAAGGLNNLTLAERAATIGYTDSTFELHPSNVYYGNSLEH